MNDLGGGPDGARGASDAAERAARELAAAGRHDDAVSTLLRAYGQEVYGFLLAFFGGDAGAASDAFSEIGERAWRGLPRFEWRCSGKAWLYVLARNAALREGARASKRARREVGLSPTIASALEEAARTATGTWQKTSSKSAIAALRDELDADDRTLLVLRIDRGLAWEDLARVFLEAEAGDPERETLKRESARLRKRYQLIKDKLVRGARAAGILPGDER